MAVKAADLDGFRFLEKTIDEEILRTQAQNILDSYAHPWDLLAEALQNSVDAIEQKIAKNSKRKRTSASCLTANCVRLRCQIPASVCRQTT
jgi:hypothetical protein